MKTFSYRQIETVIAGLGRAGWDIHWKELLQGHPAYRVVGAIEPVMARRAEAEAEIGCRTYASLEAFLADPIGELVVIATPSGGHGAETLACLELGLHVAVDKPMCQSVDEVDAMMALARARRRVLTCFHPYRFDDAFRVMQEVVRSGRLGRLVEIKCNRSAFFRRNDWVMRKARGGGMHNVWGSHTVDQCLQLAGSAVRDVFGDLQSTVTPGDADDHCKIVIRCENGLLIDAEVSNCLVFAPQPEWMVAGVYGGMVTAPDGVHVKWFEPKDAPPIVLQDGPAAGRRYDNDDMLPWREETIAPPPGRGRVEFYDNLVAAIRQDESLVITPESVRETIAVLETCRRQNQGIWAEY